MMESASKAAQSASIFDASVPKGGERRHATVLFADMASFTAISEQLGEEATFALMRSVTDILAGAIRDQGGTVSDFRGDAVMALFGVPVSQEDATLSACRAALAIQARVTAATSAFEKRFAVRPSMRIGINTGPIVVGEMQGGTTALGDTVNVAARLQTLAEPGTVLLSDLAHRLVEGLVDSVAIGEQELKGKVEAQQIYRLDGIRAGASRFDKAISRGLTDYVGRSAELAMLKMRTEDIDQGPRAVDIVGEPGIGKSRLLHEFRRQLPAGRVVVLSGACSPEGQQTPYLPFIQVVRASLDLAADDAESEVARKLTEALLALGLASELNVALLINLLGLKAPEDALAGLDGTLVGLRTRDLLLAVLRARCRQGPVVLLLEDLHWIDSASEELLGRALAGGTSEAVDSAPGQPLLVLHTRRTEYLPPWLDDGRTTELKLLPLSSAETARIAQARLGVDVLPAALERLVAERSDGNALFAEELISFLVEQGIVELSPRGVNFSSEGAVNVLPDRLKMLLSARIDRIGAADRALLQSASAIGRAFVPALLAVVHPEIDVVQRLAALEALEFIHRDAASGTWVFKHALVQDVLYDRMLSGQREALHRLIAGEVERRSSNRLEEVAEMLAHHYERSGVVAKTFTFLLMAGRKSAGIYSLEEAERYFDKALALVETTPSCTDTVGFVDLLAGITSLLHLQMRPGRILEILDRHMERLDSLGDFSQSVVIHGNFINAAMCASRWQDLVSRAEYSLAMAERLGDDRSKACARASWLMAKCLLGVSGEAEADRHINLAVAESLRVDDGYLNYLVLWCCAWDCFHRGLTERGRFYARELQERGRRLDDPRARAASHWILAWFDLVDERYDDLLANAEACLKAAITRTDRELGTLLRGMGLVFRGQTAEGMEQLWTVRERCAKDGWTFLTSASDVPLGMGMVLQGDLTGGVRFIEAIIRRNGELGYKVGRDMARMYLTQVYIEILGAARLPPLRLFLRHAKFLFAAYKTGWNRSLTMMLSSRDNPMFSQKSHWRARVDANLGFLYALKKRNRESSEYLLRARPIAEHLNSTMLLAKIDATLAKVS